MPNQIDPLTREALDRVAAKIGRHLLVQQAAGYIRCRNRGGSMEECLGIYRISPPAPGDPFFTELMDNLDTNERHELLTAVKVRMQEEIGKIDEQLTELEKPSRQR